MHPSRMVTTLGAALAATVLATAPAYAGNAHFVGSGMSTSTSGATLTVKFKEAGLESGSVETVQVSAHFEGTYSCVNGGNHVPADPKKTTISSDVQNSGEFSAGKNGNLIGSLSVSGPDPASVLDCPSGQKATLFDAVFSNVVVTDLDTGATYVF